MHASRSSCAALHDNQPCASEGKAKGLDTIQPLSPARNNLIIPQDYRFSSGESSDRLLLPRTSIIPACVEQATRWKCWLSLRWQPKSNRRKSWVSWFAFPLGTSAPAAQLQTWWKTPLQRVPHHFDGALFYDLLLNNKNKKEKLQLKLRLNTRSSTVIRKPVLQSSCWAH